MAQQQIKQSLQNSSLLQEFTEAELEALAAYLTPHEIDENALVFKEGAQGTYMCFVVEGILHVLKGSDQGWGQQSLIAVIKTGESVGEMSIIDNLPRSATVKAATAAKLLMLKDDGFAKMLVEEPLMAAKIIKAIAMMLSKHLRKTSGDLSDLMPSG